MNRKKGRPPNPEPLIQVSIKLTRKELDFIATESDNRNAFIRKLVQNSIERQGSLK